jgi:sortase (surface protein transpeptidase)
VPNPPRPHRSLLALAAVLAVIASGSPAAAAGPNRPVVLRAPDRPVAQVADASRAATAGVVRPVTTSFVPEWRVDPPAPAAVARFDVPDGAGRTREAVRQPKPKAPSAASLRGRNHVWIPALGVDRSVSFFSCSSSAYPGDRVYRWGCAGGNNVYLFGHAHSVFKSLHDAYVRGNLRKGMKVYYADARGRVSTYSIRWWKVTTPDRGEFAYASQSRPSLTLQTCVGKRSQYRLIVRLVKTG